LPLFPAPRWNHARLPPTTRLVRVVAQMAKRRVAPPFPPFRFTLPPLRGGRVKRRLFKRRIFSPFLLTTRASRVGSVSTFQPPSAPARRGPKSRVGLHA